MLEEPNVYNPFNLTTSVSNGIVDVALTVVFVVSNTPFAVDIVPPDVTTEFTPDVAVKPVPLNAIEPTVPFKNNGLNKFVTDDDIEYVEPLK
jgi:hypothetical protein